MRSPLEQRCCLGSQGELRVPDRHRRNGTACDEAVNRKSSPEIRRHSTLHCEGKGYIIKLVSRLFIAEPQQS